MSYVWIMLFEVVFVIDESEDSYQFLCVGKIEGLELC